MADAAGSVTGMTTDREAAQNLQWAIAMTTAFMNELDEGQVGLFEETVNRHLAEADGDPGRLVKGLANLAAAMATGVERTWGVPKWEFIATIADVGRSPESKK
jgi:hypothetical protein